jgi:hypothetical protein
VQDGDGGMSGCVDGSMERWISVSVFFFPLMLVMRECMHGGCQTRVGARDVSRIGRV